MRLFPIEVRCGKIMECRYLKALFPIVVGCGDAEDGRPQQIPSWGQQR